MKEDIIPAEADKIVFWIAPFIVVLAAFTVFVVVPFGPTHAITDMNIGILFMLGVSSLSVLGIVTAGWASNSHYPLIGALRSSAQMVSYEVAMGLAVVSVILMTSLNAASTGTLSMIGIVQAQQAQGEWFIFKFFPLGLIGFVIFAIAMVAETNRAPFDLPEAESELTAGFHTEYSGFRWSLFFLAEYSAMIAVSSIAVTLWLGGWLRPFPNALQRTDLGSGLLAVSRNHFSCFWPLMCFYNTARMPKHPLFRVQTMGLAGFGAVLGLIGLVLFVPAVRVRVTDIFWFAAKVAGFMYLYIWYRGTFPRYRFDQLMKVGWKVLLPTGLALLILTAIVGMRTRTAGPSCRECGGHESRMDQSSGRDAIFLLPAGRDHDHRRHPGDHAQERRALGDGADHDAAGAGGALPDALCSVRRWRADHSLCGRHHGAVPVCDHADLD